MDEVMNYSYNLPQANISKKYNWSLVANAAYYQSIKTLFPTTNSDNNARIDSLYLALRSSIGENESEDIINLSESYGAEVEFRNPVEPGKQQLDFAVRGKLVRVLRGGTVYLSGSIPAA